VDTVTQTQAGEIPPQVLDAVRSAICESLVLTPAQVTLESRLIDDLGADSLDFADIVFTLGADLNLPVRDSEFSFLTRLDLSSPEVMKDGHLTPDVVARLATWLPGLAAASDTTQVSPRELFSLITVEAICVVVSRWLAAG
jgi:acyl carrier protein